MNASQIHLALNHVPLFFSITGALILLYGFFRKNDTVKTMSLYFMIAGAVFTIPVFLTGEGAEELVENLPGVSESLIEQHEGFAKTGLIVILVTGAIALFTLFAKRKASLFKTGLLASAVLSLISFAIMAQTAHLGGQIRHTEIRGSSAAGNSNNEPGKENGGEKDDD